MSVSAEFSTVLHKLLLVTRKLGLDPEALQNYVEHGPDDALVPLMQCSTQSTGFNQLQVLLSGQSRPLKDMVVLLGAQPPEVVKRVGLVYHAILQQLQWWGLNQSGLKLAATQPWLVGLLQLHGQHTHATNLTPSIRYAQLEALLADAGLPAHALLASLFDHPDYPLTVDALKDAQAATDLRHPWSVLCGLPDYDAALQRHCGFLTQQMSGLKSAQRQHVLVLLGQAQLPTLQLYQAALIEYLIGPSKPVAEGAMLLLRRLLPDVQAALMLQLQQTNKVEGRERLLRLLGECQSDRARACLRECLAQETQPRLLTLLQGLLGEQPEHVSAPVLPQLPQYDPQQPLSAEQQQQAEQCLQGFVVEPPKDEGVAKKVRRWMHLGEQLRWTASDNQRVLQVLNGQSVSFNPQGYFYLYHQAQALLDQLSPLWALCNDSPVIAARLYQLLYSSVKQVGASRSRWYDDQFLNNVLEAAQQHGATWGLLEFSQALHSHGLAQQRLIAHQCMHRPWGSHALAEYWPSEKVASFFLHYPQFLEEGLKPDGGNFKGYTYVRARVFALISSLPYLSANLARDLEHLALFANKTDRRAAQRCLVTLCAKPGQQALQQRLYEVACAALSDGKAEVRQSAAEWLAQAAIPSAIESLERALHKEKQDNARAAIMSALRTLGVPTERFLERSALQQEAQRVLKRGWPKELAWLDPSALPPLLWLSDGARVDGEVLQSWLVQAVKLKTPEPNALQQLLGEQLRPAARLAFAQWLLDAWLAADTRTVSAEEALQRAQTEAKQQLQWCQQYPQYASHSPYLGKCLEEIVSAVLPTHQQALAGSAIDSKGLLALVAVCADGSIAPTVLRYLKQWHGQRMAQCKALLSMLAWIDHPAALQVLLSVGNRFRTKGLQEEATRLAQGLAERKGWTVDEMADRSIPTAGLDEQGELSLDYGSRQFTVQLRPSLELALLDDSGKPLKSLPAARKDDDPERVKQAKKQYSTAKKEISAVLELQRARLYEAMCLQRSWSFQDWQLFLLQHPLMRQLCQRLLWAEQLPDGRLGRSFRPLDDGTLSDAQDNSLQLDPTTPLVLLHSLQLQEAHAQLWRTHLSDYAVEPLFEQLPHHPLRLSEAQLQARELKQFEGYLLESLAFRGLMLKRGYNPGTAGDGGWLSEYEKRFPGLNLVAIVDFSGHGLPIEKHPVALLDLHFERRSAEQYSGQRLRLSEVPPVLLAECWQDLALLASQGSGFDAEWEKKVYPY